MAGGEDEGNGEGGREGNSGWPGAFVGADCGFPWLSRRFPRAWSRGSATMRSPRGGPRFVAAAKEQGVSGTSLSMKRPVETARTKPGPPGKTPDKRLGGTFLEWPHWKGRKNSDLSDACANAPAKLPNGQFHGIPQRGQRRTSRVRDLRHCPHDGHFPQSGPQISRGSVKGVFQRFASQNRKKSSPCAQRRMPHIRGIRRCAH